MKCNIENKVKFVKGLSDSITPFKTGIKSVEYHVFEHVDNGWKQEYLVINYDGGARTVRNCNGNSFSAIFEELAQYLDSGYYVEVGHIEDYEKDPKWKRIDLDYI
jgi:hypothetical protein